MGKFSNPREMNEHSDGYGLDEFDSIPQHRKTGKTNKIVLISLCSVAAVLLIAAIVMVCYVFGSNPDNKLILNNVTVGGINLGGMTKEEASAALHRATDNTFTKEDMVVILPDTILCLSPANTGAALDVDAVVDAAYSHGRSGTRAEKQQAQENAANNQEYPIALLSYMTLDLDYIRSQLDAYGTGFNSTYEASGVELKGEAPITDITDENFDPEAPCQTLVVTMGNPGRYVDIDSVYNQVLDAYSFNTFCVEVNMSEEESIPEEINLEEVFETYCTEAVDATLDQETYDVIDEVYGYQFDLEEAQAMLEEAAYGDTFEIDFQFVAPEVTGDSLRELLFRDVLGYCETKHTTNENRNTNLRLACAAIDGMVLYPGETFDFNTVVGKRTVEKGYKAAAAYSGGLTVDTIGGGICQVSSTLYYTTLIADLEIINRQPHSYVSSYMPLGTDATVSWGGPHFTFKNSTNYPIRIEMEVSDGFVKATLIGTDEKDYYIEMEYEVIGYETATTVYEEFTESNNPNGYTDGEVITTAYNGCTVNTYKCKYDKETGELIERVFDQLSRYKKRDKVVAVLVSTPTEAPSESTEPTTPPTEGTEATTPPTEATTPPTEATTPPTEATTPPTEATTPPAESGAGES